MNKLNGSRQTRWTRQNAVQAVSVIPEESNTKEQLQA